MWIEIEGNGHRAAGSVIVTEEEGEHSDTVTAAQSSSTQLLPFDTKLNKTDALSIITLCYCTSPCCNHRSSRDEEESDRVPVKNQRGGENDHPV